MHTLTYSPMQWMYVQGDRLIHMCTYTVDSIRDQIVRMTNLYVRISAFQMCITTKLIFVEYLLSNLSEQGTHYILHSVVRIPIFITRGPGP